MSREDCQVLVRAVCLARIIVFDVSRMDEPVSEWCAGVAHDEALVDSPASNEDAGREQDDVFTVVAELGLRAEQSRAPRLSGDATVASPNVSHRHDVFPSDGQPGIAPCFARHTGGVTFGTSSF